MSAIKDIAVVTERGQVSIPAHLRKELSLTRGQRLLWEKVSENELRVCVLRSSQGARAMRGFARRFRPTRRTTDEWMNVLREGES